MSLGLDEATIKAIFHNKISSAEIEVCFFTYCNLRCSFCFQETANKEGLDEISKKAEVVNKWLQETGYGDDCKISLLGGELFQDSLDLYGEYENFIKIVKESYPLVDISFISNLQFNKDTLAKVKALLERTKTSLSTSLDLFGRPSDKNVFMHNIEALSTYCASVTFILTKPACEKLLSGKYDQDTFDKMYSSIPLHFDFYTPNNGASNLMPSDWLLYNAIKMLSKKYPNLEQIKALRSGEPNEMSCRSLKKVVVLPNGELHNCKHSFYDQGSFKTEIDYKSNIGIINSFLEENGCLSCEYFDRCTLGCFLMNDHKSYIKEMDICFMKRLFSDWGEDESKHKSNLSL